MIYLHERKSMTVLDAGPLRYPPFSVCSGCLDSCHQSSSSRWPDGRHHNVIMEKFRTPLEVSQAFFELMTSSAIQYIVQHYGTRGPLDLNQQFSSSGLVQLLCDNDNRQGGAMLQPFICAGQVFPLEGGGESSSGSQAVMSDCTDVGQNESRETVELLPFPYLFPDATGAFKGRSGSCGNLFQPLQLEALKNLVPATPVASLFTLSIALCLASYTSALIMYAANFQLLVYYTILQCLNCKWDTYFYFSARLVCTVIHGVIRSR